VCRALSATRPRASARRPTRVRHPTTPARRR
jgi:hypothetical protein